MTKATDILGVALIPIGVVFAVLAFPLITGGEELTLWDTVGFGNINAMFFMQAGIVLWLGIRTMKKQTVPRRKAAWGVLTILAVFAVCYYRAVVIPGPFGVY